MLKAYRAAEAVGDEIKKKLLFEGSNEESTWFSVNETSELMVMEHTKKIKKMNETLMPKGILVHVFEHGLRILIVFVEFLDEDGCDPYKHGIPIKRRQMLKHPYHLAFMNDTPKSVCFITFTTNSIIFRRQSKTRTAFFQIAISNAARNFKFVQTVNETVNICIEGESVLSLVFPNQSEAVFFHDHVTHVIGRRIEADKQQEK